MYADVVNFVSSCDICLAYKQSTHGTIGKMGRPKQVSRPFQMLSIDFLGPLPTSRKQHSYLLVVVCCFSKYTMLFPVRRATSESVIRILENDVFLVHGIPQFILMDNASYFSSNDLNSFFNKYKIPNIHFTPKYTPQVNTVERYNKTVITSIASFIENDHRAWDVNLPKIQFAINSSVNETTNYTPNFLVYGRELVACGSHYTHSDEADEISFLPRDIYCENIGHLAKIFNDVQKSLWEAHVKNTKQYNLRRKETEFNVNDIVWKRTYVQSDKDRYFSKKLAPKFVKCRIVAKLSPLVYQLQDMNGQDLGTWHVKDFKAFKNQLIV
ncbi:uncharacterized protein LOC123874579 [Maniola jurtina]|uniref:uncharacterized protein LOC123874579 n=1 Tax=Maniola jurtina TaxID=191418 RepID=UPI001E68B0D0|nr:uncharacterized protein LOC123874579 [Maniola jurtina]